MTADYKVGRGRPPKSSQFRPGQSGNPNGRPKRAANLSSVASELAEEMEEIITIRENGAERKITKKRAVLKALVTAAIKGDIRAINSVMTCTRNFGLSPELPVAKDPEPSSQQLDILEAFVEREKKRRDRSKQPAEIQPGPRTLSKK